MIRKYYKDWPNQVRKIWYHEDYDGLDFTACNKLTLEKMPECSGYKKGGMSFDTSLQSMLVWNSGGED